MTTFKEGLPEFMTSEEFRDREMIEQLLRAPLQLPARPDKHVHNTIYGGLSGKERDQRRAKSKKARKAARKNR